MASTTTPDAEEANEPLFIARVKVDQLFGRYTYDLRCSDSSRNCSQLLLLYGENGTGKTTVLWLVYHLLSNQSGGGHRTFLARSRFRRLSVQLSDGTEVSATRPQGKVDGGFRMSVRRGSRRQAFNYGTGADGEIRLPPSDPSQMQFMKALPDLNLVFLPDERKMSAEIVLQSRESEARHLRFREAQRARFAHREPSGATQPTTGLILSKVVQWIRGQALAGSNVGQLNANSIYSEIVSRIARPSSEARVAVDADKLAQVLAEQAVRNHKYAKFGFTSELEVGSLVKSVLKSKSKRDRVSTIAQVLTPFIDGNEARLRALERVQKTVETFVDSINSFYCDKTLRFHLQDGIRIVSEDGSALDPRLLSSGEKQLLILFCNVIMTGQKPSIFIIDEPELSLNIKWQRQLIDALLACVKGTSLQFVFATHSIEILAKHRQSVVRLENRLKGKSSAQQALFGNA